MAVCLSQLHEGAPGIESSCPSLRCITSQSITEFLITSTATSRMIHRIVDRVDRAAVDPPVRFPEAYGIQLPEVRVVGPPRTRRIQILFGRALPDQAASAGLSSVTICVMVKQE